MFSLLIYALAAFVIIVFGLMGFNFQPKRKASQTPTRHQPNKFSLAQKTVAKDVQNKLFSMVNGDEAAANRLLIRTRKLNPQKPEQWIWEKVIFDLERDRH